MIKTPSTIDESIRTNDQLYYYWYYWLKDPNVFSSVRAIKLKEFLESNYGESHARSLKDDMITLERKEEELINLLLAVPVNHYSKNYKKFIRTMYAHLFYHDDKQTKLKSPEEIAKTFVAESIILDWKATIMVVIDKVRPKPELEHLEEFVKDLSRKDLVDDEMSNLLDNLPKWAKQSVEIMQQFDGIKNYDLMARMKENGLPDSYEHISELFKSDSAKAFYKENITSDSAYYKLKGPEFIP